MFGAQGGTYGELWREAVLLGNTALKVNERKQITPRQTARDLAHVLVRGSDLGVKRAALSPAPVPLKPHEAPKPAPMTSDSIPYLYQTCPIRYHGQKSVYGLCLSG